MKGLNRVKINLNESNRRKSNGIKCVFLSHQKKDRKECKKIADYLIAANIDVYFDEYDKDLKNYNQTKDANGVTNSIKKGIEKSSHMLCVLSPNTLKSKWVPFEIGYGFDKNDLGVLTLKDISDSDIPDYIKTAKTIVRGTHSLNDYILRIHNKLYEAYESSPLIKAHTDANHVLDGVLNWDK